MYTVYTFVCFIAIVLIVVTACITTGQTVVVRRIQCECACDLENHWMKLFDFKVWAFFHCSLLLNACYWKCLVSEGETCSTVPGVVDLNIARKKAYTVCHLKNLHVFNVKLWFLWKMRAFRLLMIEFEQIKPDAWCKQTSETKTDDKCDGVGAICCKSHLYERAKNNYGWTHAILSPL